MRTKDYSKPDPDLIDRVRSASDDHLFRYLENAKRNLPQTQWLVDAIADEQIKRGGLRNLTVESVREAILRYAQKGRTCTYKMVADALGVSWEQARWRLPPVLGKICEMESHDGRPLLTAIVTSQQGVCGQGFFEIAARIGHTFSDNAEFQQDEQQRVFDHWKESRGPDE